MDSHRVIYRHSVELVFCFVPAACLYAADRYFDYFIFFEKRFNDPTSLLRVGSALIILIFFTIYSSSGLVAAGKLFESMFNIDYSVAVISGAVVIVAYTFLGGFMAVCWTDFSGRTHVFCHCACSGTGNY